MNKGVSSVSIFSWATPSRGRQVGDAKSAISNIFEAGCVGVELEGSVHFNPHSS